MHLIISIGFNTSIPSAMKVHMRSSLSSFSRTTFFGLIVTLLGILVEKLVFAPEPGLSVERFSIEHWANCDLSYASPAKDSASSPPCKKQRADYNKTPTQSDDARSDAYSSIKKGLDRSSSALPGSSDFLDKPDQAAQRSHDINKQGHEPWFSLSMSHSVNTFPTENWSNFVTRALPEFLSFLDQTPQSVPPPLSPNYEAHFQDQVQSPSPSSTRSKRRSSGEECEELFPSAVSHLLTFYNEALEAIDPPLISHVDHLEQDSGDLYSRSWFPQESSRSGLLTIHPPVAPAVVDEPTIQFNSRKNAISAAAERIASQSTSTDQENWAQAIIKRFHG